MLRFLRLTIIVVIASGLLILPLFISSADPSSVVSVIVELRDDPAALHVARTRQNGITVSDDDLQALRDQIRARQDEFLNALRTSAIPFELQFKDIMGYDGNVAATVPLRYDLVFNGISLKVPQDAVPAIEAMAQVKKVHPNEILTIDLDKSVSHIRAAEVYGAVKELTQFDDFREGFEGQGINIAVIDTGIEWQHEMFGGDPTPPRLGVAPSVAALNTNRKVTYNLPFTDVVVEDGFGHGTHVSSTAAGYLGFAPGNDGLPLTADDVKVHGVAPQARLMAYKVCSDSLSTVGSLTGAIGGCFTDVIILAIQDAVSPRTLNGLPKPVAHVINMSLGSARTGPDSATAVASDNAVKLGTVVVASAGNSGAQGEGTVGAPSTGRRVISVAASNDPGSGAQSTDVLDPTAVDRNATGAVVPASGLAPAAGQRRDIRLFPMAGTPLPPAGAMAQYYVFVANGQLATDYPASVRGRVALVKTTNGVPTTFAQIANNSAAAGAVAAILISNTQNPTAVKSTIPGANISTADGEYLVDLISSTDNNAVDPPSGTLSEFPIRIQLSFSPDIAGFSSLGPVLGFGQVKPDVSAPGVNVLAAVPPASLLGALSGSNYGNVSGTSMASPHTAGAAALVKQAHLDWNPDMIRTALINTATNQRNKAGAPEPDGLGADSILAQGGGLIDVFEAVNAKALMGLEGDGIAKPSILGSHSFGAVPVINNRCLHTESVNVAIQDVSGEGGTYNLSVANNRGLERSGISVTTSSSSVTLSTGGAAGFTVNVAFDGNVVRDTTAPIQLQWYLVAQRVDGAESLRMPFYLRATPSVAAAPGANPPTLQTIQGEFVDSQSRQIDFDGAFTLQWTPRGGETGFEVERCVGAGCSNWQVVANVAASTTSLSLTNQQNGEYSFRVRGLFPGQICSFVTAPSNVQGIVVDQRGQVTITNLVKTAISNVSLNNGVFQLDLRMTNQSSDTFVPFIHFNIVGINSASGTVRVINADNGGGGISPSDPALFDYSRQLGSEDEFSPGETTGPRTMRFQDDASELFTFNAVVTAYQRGAGASQSAAVPEPGDSGTSGSAAGSSSPLLDLKAVLRFSVNPVTGTILVELVSFN